MLYCRLQVLDGSCTQGQQLFEFRSESSYGTAPEGLFVQIDDCAALLADGDDYFSEYMCKWIGITDTNLIKVVLIDC